MRKLPDSTWPYLFTLAWVLAFALFYFFGDVIWSDW